MGEPAGRPGVAHNHSNGRVWKWCSGVLGILLVAAIVGLVDTIKQIEHLETTQELMGKNVEANAKWIRDWSNVLRVPERDQRQDSNIEDIMRRVALLERGRSP